jgi:micrococcal nuclease
VRARPFVLIVATLAAASLLGWRLGEARRVAGEGVVTEVVDGDTVVVRLAGRTETVRLLGVDTPETHHPSRPVECYGPEAATHTASRLAGQRVRLEYDVETRDRYGRLLAYVLRREGDRWVRYNDELLRDGWAELLVIPPNGRHAREMLDLELAARREGRGLWGACG